ncbi:MAG: peptidase domain-containing ABC transporter [Cyclobacteriaceae bacterium]|nr:peptidase domain-containing ABC transporter [Cyclobacteriaceae bacterium]
MNKGTKVKQRDITDCGAACLASIAAHYKLRYPVARIRQLASTDKKGTNVLGMIEAAKQLGIDSKGVRGTFESLSTIPLPAVAHVTVKEVLHHFIVIYKVKTHYIEIMDPADGQMHQLGNEEFKKTWTGVLILMLPEESFQKGNLKESVFNRLWTLVKPHKSVLIQALFGALVYTFIGLSTSIYVQKIVDYVLIDGNRNLLNLMSVVMFALMLTAIFIGYMKSLFTLQTGQIIDTRLILGYYKHLLKLPQQFFDTMRVGEVLSRINDAVKIRAFINDVFINLAVNFFIIVLSFCLMFTYYWKLAIIMLLVIPFYSIIYLITNRLNKKVERRLMENSAELEAQLVESIHAMSTIKSLGLEEQAQYKTEDRFYTLLNTVYQSGLNALSSGFSTEFVSRSFTILLLWIGAGFVLDQQITPGELLSFYALIGYFTSPVSNTIGLNKIFQNAYIAADRLFEIIDLQHEDEENKIELTPSMIGDIRFKDVFFRYGTRTTVFEGLNLLIPKSSVVALVGESGSGKSTIIHIIQKLYPILSGNVHIGEYDLKYLDHHSLRKLIAIVPQKIDLFAGNVIDNIAAGDPTPDMKKIISISTSLGILDFIERLPNGFNTYLGENGATLSGGQKQRIAIARALYRDPEILILDEATSSLDAASEQYVQKMIQILRSQGKTVIIIAHRLSTIALADKIVLIENGKVLEEGSHSSLFNKKSHYYEWCRNQYPVEVPAEL